jgi:hypothetical protein
MKLSEAKNAGFFKVQMELGEAFGVKAEDITMTLREPNHEEQMELIEDTNKDNDNGPLRFWKKYFHNLVIEFEGVEDDNGKSVKKDEFVKLIKDSGTLYTNVMRQYFEALTEHTNPTKKNT